MQTRPTPPLLPAPAVTSKPHAPPSCQFAGREQRFEFSLERYAVKASHLSGRIVPLGPRQVFGAVHHEWTGKQDRLLSGLATDDGDDSRSPTGRGCEGNR